MFRHGNPIDEFAKHPEMTLLLDIAGEWHERFDAEDYVGATTVLSSLHAAATELLGPDADSEQQRLWAARAMGVSGLARVAVKLPVSNLGTEL